MYLIRFSFSVPECEQIHTLLLEVLMLFLSKCTVKEGFCLFLVFPCYLTIVSHLRDKKIKFIFQNVSSVWSFHVGDEKFLELDCGDGCTIT